MNDERFLFKTNDNHEFEKYLRIVSRKTGKDLYACLEHPEITPAYNYWIDFDANMASEFQTFISVNLFSMFLPEKIRNKSLELHELVIGNPVLSQLLIKEFIAISGSILEPVQDLESLSNFALDKNDFRFFSSESPRIFYRAAIKILKGQPVEKTLQEEEFYFGKKIKFRDRFLQYWNEKTNSL